MCPLFFLFGINKAVQVFIPDYRPRCWPLYDSYWGLIHSLHWTNLPCLFKGWIKHLPHDQGVKCHFKKSTSNILTGLRRYIWIPSSLNCYLTIERKWARGKINYSVYNHHINKVLIMSHVLCALDKISPLTALKMKTRWDFVWHT